MTWAARTSTTAVPRLPRLAPAPLLAGHLGLAAPDRDRLLIRAPARRRRPARRCSGAAAVSCGVVHQGAILAGADDPVDRCGAPPSPPRSPRRCRPRCRPTNTICVPGQRSASAWAWRSEQQPAIALLLLDRRGGPLGPRLRRRRGLVVVAGPRGRRHGPQRRAVGGEGVHRMQKQPRAANCRRASPRRPPAAGGASGRPRWYPAPTAPPAGPRCGCVLRRCAAGARCRSRPCRCRRNGRPRPSRRSRRRPRECWPWDAHRGPKEALEPIVQALVIEVRRLHLLDRPKGPAWGTPLPGPAILTSVHSTAILPKSSYSAKTDVELCRTTRLQTPGSLY